jgi:hypothetical protein
MPTNEGQVTRVAFKYERGFWAALKAYCSQHPAKRSVKWALSRAAALGYEVASYRRVAKWARDGVYMDGWPELQHSWTEIAAMVDRGELKIQHFGKMNRIARATGQLAEPDEVGSDELVEGDEQPPRSKAVTDVISHQPTTRAEFLEWLEVGLGTNFKGGKIVVGMQPLVEGHTTPFAWMFETYCLACGRSDDDEWRELSEKQISQALKKYLLHGPRGGMKTLGLAALWFTLCWFIPRYSVTHAATEKPQAAQCLEYLRDYWAKSPLFSDGIIKVNTLGVEFANGSRLNLTTASVNGFNSDHTISFSCDEVETLPMSILLEGLAIPQEEIGRNLPSITILGSTQKEPGMTMSELIRRSMQGEYKYLLWNCWDVVEECSDWRTEDLPAGLRCSDYSALTEQVEDLERRRLELRAPELAALQELIAKLEQLERNCKLVADCRGIAKRGAGHLKIDRVIERLRDSREMFEAQTLCERPSPKGAVYPKFSKQNISDQALFRAGCRIIGLADYGYALDPAAANLVCLNGPYIDTFFEYHAEGVLSDEQAAAYELLSRRYGVEYWIVDISAKELITKMRRRGLTVIGSRRKIKTGIEKLSALICNGLGFRRLRIHPSCTYTIDEIQALKKSPVTGKPKDGQPDHHCDCLRYLAEVISDQQQAGTIRIKPPRHAGRTLGSRRKDA